MTSYVLVGRLLTDDDDVSDNADNIGGGLQVMLR